MSFLVRDRKRWEVHLVRTDAGKLLKGAEVETDAGKGEDHKLRLENSLSKEMKRWMEKDNKLRVAC